MPIGYCSTDPVRSRPNDEAWHLAGWVCEGLFPKGGTFLLLWIITWVSITLPSCNTLGTAYLLCLHILNSGNQTNTLPRPLFAFRRNKNLENSRVKSVLPGSRVLVQRSITGSNPIRATHKCGNCHACDFAMVSPELEWGKKKFLFKEMTKEPLT